MPEKQFYLADECLECHNMKKTTLNDLAACLKYDRGEIFLSDEIIEQAKKPLEAMLSMC